MADAFNAVHHRHAEISEYQLVSLASLVALFYQTECSLAVDTEINSVLNVNSTHAQH